VRAIVVSGLAVLGCSSSIDTITAITTSPLELTPTFSPSIGDYYVRCTEGDNSLSVTVDAASTTTTTYLITEDQPLVIGDYWIRCLPHDFPNITVVKYPDVGTPTPGYYLVNSMKYAAVLDGNGTPVWYQHAKSACDVDSLAPGQISYLPNAEFPYSFDTSVNIELDVLGTQPTMLQSPDAPTDAHELRLLANGDYLLFADVVVPGVDLTGLAGFGSNESIDDCKIEEVSPDGNLVWSWLASDHVDPVRESLAPATNMIDQVNVVDWFHCNSIDVAANGDLLVSARHANAVYYVERATGQIAWKLGGTPHNKDGAAHIVVTNDSEGGFNLQHDARFAGSGDITLFDDHGADAGAGSAVARGVELALDHDAGTAQVVWQFLGTGESQYMGSFRRYSDGDSVIGWGYVSNSPRILTETDSSGNDVLDVLFSLPMPTEAVSYRAVKVPLSQLDIAELRATTAQ